ncbi:MAG TPA: CPBP family intramembrane metalloprotease [Thermoplasmatales archaeon]|nr:CPBP family intramembrane metalloprotease [Thermoplasmatales archaeon]
MLFTMDFSPRRLGHLGASVLLLITFLIFIVVPILSFFGFSSSSSDTNSITISPIFLLVIQLLLVFVLFVFVPILWYKVVNRFDKRQILDSINLKRTGLDEAVIWGIITAILAFVVIVSIGIILNLLGFDVSKSSNITELNKLFPIPYMLILITVQPFAEEFFFRGFLLDKLLDALGPANAIIITSFLFGLAHLLYGNIYPAVMTGVVGFLLAIPVVRTKNLYASIVAHVLFNLMSFSIYLFGELFTQQSLIL